MRFISRLLAFVSFYLLLASAAAHAQPARSASAASAVRAFEGDDAIVIADFEGGAYGDGWKITGKAFGGAPKTLATTNQARNRVTGWLGEGYVNTYNPNDKPTGTLTSPPFKIERPYIRFLIGGGGFFDETCMNLLVDGKTVRAAAGPNTQPGGSEALAESGWDVRDLAGKIARIQIIDTRSGGWGHINVDHIIQSGRAPAKFAPPPPAGATVLRREIAADKKFLFLPVRAGKHTTTLDIFLGDERLHHLGINLATDGKPDWWAAFDISAWRGKTLRITGRAESLDAIRTGEKLPPLPGAYREPERPQFHFSPERGWINDPNGMVWHAGEWHLFYQYNPYGNASANKSWGHAVSADLVHWKELPIALLPCMAGGTKGQVYSGSAIIDKLNTAGFGAGAMIAVYTDTEGGPPGNPRAEAIAYSRDNGRTFTYYSGNPIYPHDGRDPKAFWYEKDKCWVIIVYDQSNKEKQRNFQILTSKDMKKWTLRSEIAGYDLYECPEFFEMPIDGDPKRTAWVVMDAASNYLVGDFDGKTFTPATKQRLRNDLGGKLQQGYATQTFNDAPDGRRIGIAWARRVRPKEGPFGCVMTVPIEFTLRRTPAGLRLFTNPVRELETLRHAPKTHAARAVPAGETALDDKLGGPADIEAAFTLPSAKADASAGLKVCGLEITCDATGAVRCGEAKAQLPSPPANGKLELRVLVDRGIMEVFVNGGAAYFSLDISAKEYASPTLALIATQSGASLDALTVHRMKSIW